MRNRKGITLVALVITIIILLILAGITINLTIGQRGILKRAEEAGKNYQEVAGKEDEELRKLDNIIAGTDISNEPKITMVDGVPVPNGFKHIEGTKEDGFVIKDVSVDGEGKPTSTNGNEFVWIPCTEDGKNGSIKYDRYAFSRDGWAYKQTKNEETGEIKREDTSYMYTEVMPTIQRIRTELDSVKQYGGFYLGRYEIGIVDYNTNVDTNNSNNEKKWTGYRNGRAVVQKNEQVWNYITRDMAVEVAEGMYGNYDAVTSRLCSSYAWDTALQFIGGDYAVNSEGDNYSGELKKTGEVSTPRRNIYDMGGNAWEWTTENYSYQDSSSTERGGFYLGSATNDPAGFRNSDSGSRVGDFIGARATLFVGL